LLNSKSYIRCLYLFIYSIIVYIIIVIIILLHMKNMTGIYTEYVQESNDWWFYLCRCLFITVNAKTEATNANGSAKYHIPYVYVSAGLCRMVLSQWRHVFYSENRWLPFVQLFVSISPFLIHTIKMLTGWNVDRWWMIPISSFTRCEFFAAVEIPTDWVTTFQSKSLRKKEKETIYAGTRTKEHIIDLRFLDRTLIVAIMRPWNNCNGISKSIKSPPDSYAPSCTPFIRVNLQPRDLNTYVEIPVTFLYSNATFFFSLSFSLSFHWSLNYTNTFPCILFIQVLI